MAEYHSTSNAPVPASLDAVPPTRDNVDVNDLLVCGYSVIPVNLEKKPYSSWSEYQHRRPTYAEVQGWRIRYTPPAWAVATGAISGIVTLDFDGEAGADTMRKLGIARPHRRTGSGGYHVDYPHPGWPVKTLNHKAMRELGERYPGMDIRADGGYVVMLGRSHKGAYEWLRPPGDLEFLLNLPGDVLDFLGLRRPPELGAPAAEVHDHDAPRLLVPGAVLDGGTPPARTTATGPSPAVAAPLVTAELLIEMALSRVCEGGRNNAGMWLACQCRDNGYTESEARAIMQAFQSACPAFDQHGEKQPYTITEAMATVRSAFSRPAREPWGGYDEQDVEAIEVEPAETATDVLGSTALRGFSKPEPEAEEPEGAAEPERAEPVPGPPSRFGNHESGPRLTAGAVVELPKRRTAVDAPDERSVDADKPRNNPGPANEGKVANAADTEARRKARALLQAELHLAVVRIVKLGEKDGFHVMHLADGRTCELGKTAKFSCEKSVKVAVLDALQFQLPPIKKGRWRHILNAMIELTEIEAGYTPEEMISEWIELFTESGCARVQSLTEPTEWVAQVFAGFDRQSVRENFESIYELRPGGKFVLRLRNLYGYVTRYLNVKLSQPDLAVHLGRVGFRKLSTLNGPMWKGKRLRCQRVWVAPAANFQLGGSGPSLKDGDDFPKPGERGDPIGPIQ
jgi:hypothetical protein